MNAERGTDALPRIAIVGSTSPLGRELRELLNPLPPTPSYSLTLLDTDDYAGLLQEFQNDIQIVQVIAPQRLEAVDAAVFACQPELMNQYLDSEAYLPPVTIDLTGREATGPTFVNGLSATPAFESDGRFIAPRAETIILSTLLARLDAAKGVSGSEATILTPASEAGRRGIERLQEQTVQVLNFQKDSSKDTSEVAFNILTGDNGETPHAARVARQVGRLCPSSCPAPAIVYGRVPIFQGMALSIHVRLIRESSSEEILDTLTGNDGRAFFAYDRTQTSLGVIGKDLACISLVEDAADPNAFWIWIFADNLRVAAGNTAQLLRVRYQT